MKLSDFDLKQIDDHRIEGLPYENLVTLTKSLLNDLKEARDRLNQNSNNSSRPQSSIKASTLDFLTQVVEAARNDIQLSSLPLISQPSLV